MVDFKVQGYYCWVVVDKNNKVVSASPKMMKNFILDQGLDGIAVRAWADSFTSCALGTGTSSPSAGQTGLDTEVVRTSSYFVDDVNANKAYLSDSVYVLRRTFRFDVEPAPIEYTEAGFGYAASGPGGLFSRTLLNPTISVEAGNRVYMQYELNIRMSPTTNTTASSPIVGLTSAGVYKYQMIGLKGIEPSTGATEDYDAAEGCNEPSTNSKGFLSTNSDALAAFGSSVDRSGTTYETNTTLSSYTNGSFTRHKLMTVSPASAVASNWRSLGLGAYSGASYTNSGFVHVFDSNFDKGSFRLYVAFNMTWGRFTGTQGTLFYFLPEEELMLRQQNQLLNYFGQNTD